jgi:SAM-dependent methyltransferase
MKSFTSISGKSWLQGCKLLPLLERQGAIVSGTVLDFGCGKSPWRTFFTTACSYIRMDRYPIDPDVIVVDDCGALPLSDSTVDAIIVSRTLGDIADQVELMREFARVLVSGGRILVYEAISYPQHDLPHDYWRVLPAGLRWAGEQAGLTMSELEYCGGYFTQVALQLNTFIIGELGGSRFMRLFAAGLRAVTNLACAGLDWAIPRPSLATDYFAVLIKVDGSKTPPARA